VIATHNRRDTLLRSLERLAALPERPELVVVDDASGDGTAAAVREHFPQARVVECSKPRGQAAARNAGVSQTRAPCVAFCDDDSWFAPGALAHAATAFSRRRRLGAVAARVIVEPAGRVDPTCVQMAASPLGAVPGLDAPRVLGFVACGAVVRRSAFVDAGGFAERYGGGSEEQLLAIDLAATGWDAVYMRDVVAHHQPARGGRVGRRHVAVRNDLWTAWLRRPLPAALRVTARKLATAGPLTASRALAGAIAGLPWVLRERRTVPLALERALRLIS
jgi:glycosyltransferase involved in cell wall biosynthesis